MSIYSRCSKAAHTLMENPPEEHGGVFTEIDIVRMAATDAWSTTNFREALRHANQVVGTLYRARKLSRFGPVKLDKNNLDYARIASKVVYASAANGPKQWKTPNGTFPRLMIEDDTIGRQGRRRGTNRNDLEPWEDQEIRPLKSEVDPAIIVKEAEPVEALAVSVPESDLEEAERKIRLLENEVETLRRGSSGDLISLVDDRVLAILGEIEERLSRVENESRVHAVNGSA